jgi:hypothetical protein
MRAFWFLWEQGNPTWQRVSTLPRAPADDVKRSERPRARIDLARSVLLNRLRET